MSAPATLVAETAKSSYQVYGSGQVSCGTWAEELANKSPMRQLDLAWILGWISSYNRYSDAPGNVSSGADSAAVSGWIDNYCAANPLSNLAIASDELIMTFRLRGP